MDDTFEDSMFNYKGVETDTTSTTTGFSMESYLGMTPYSEYGYFMDQGFKAQYYDDDQCRVLFCPGEIFETNSMSYQSLLLSITNKSGDAGSGNTRD